MKKILYAFFIILSIQKIYAQSSIILPNGTVIPSFTQATRPANPTRGQLIYQTDGTAGLYIWNGTTWTAVSTGSGGGSGTVTNVTANSPLSVTNGSTTPAITIQQANGTTNGFLSSTDWTTFNNKQNTLQNADATTSGILTSADWNIFNNKQNTLQNANATTSGILTSTDWNIFNNKQNPLSNANATTSGILTSADWNNFNNKQNPLSNANATTSGILTSADWNNFNSKQNALQNADATTSGILTSADWNTFNNKQNTLQNANATTSGILTSADWNNFNSKQNALQNADATTSGILTSADWNTFNSKQSRLYPANGLKVLNDSIKLGGSLSESTFINLNTKDFSLGGYGSEQLVINNPMPNNNNYGLVESGFGQSFQATYSGFLTKITLTLKVSLLQNPTIPISYTIYNGDGFGGAILKTGNFNLPPTSTYYPVPTEIGNLNLPVTAGNMYTIKVDYGTYSCYVGVANGTAMPGVFYYLNGNPYPSWDAGILTYQISNSDVLRVRGGNQKVVLPYLSGSGTRPLMVAADGSLESGSNFQSSSTTNGFLSSTDWNTFNNKQNALSNANATTSGILTSTDWNTFNNKQNALSNANATTSGILTSADWNTFNNKQNALPNANAATSGILTNADWNTFNNKQNALPNANAATSGILTSADWNAFNNKFSLPPLNSGSLLFSDGSTIAENNSMLFWDNTYFRIGVGTRNPSFPLHVSSQLSPSNNSFSNSWIVSSMGALTGSRLVMGTRDGNPTIGATNDLYTQWVPLNINPGGSVRFPYYASSSAKLVSFDNSGLLTNNTVENGITLANNKVRLGGQLSDSTEINLNNYKLSLNSGLPGSQLVINNPIPNTSNFEIVWTGFGQSFKAVNTGTLDGIVIYIYMPDGFSSHSFNYTIYEGEGYGGTILKTGVGYASNTSLSAVNLNNLYLPISAGVTYTLRISTPSNQIVVGFGVNDSIPGVYYNTLGTAFPSHVDLAMLTFETQYNGILHINGATKKVIFPQLVGSSTRPLSVSADGSLAVGDPYSLSGLTSGSILFSNGTTISQSNANLFWDNTNKALGIGTTSPSAGLHINGYGWDNGFRISSSGTTVGPAVFLDGETDFAMISTGTGAGAGANKFAIYDATANQYRMTINNSGAMGVGTSNPTTKLEVSGLGGLKVSSNYNNSGYSDWVSGNFGGQTGDRLVVGIFNQTPTIGGHNSDLNQWRNLALNPIGGNVGIGTDAPTAKLDIEGTVRMRTGAAANAVLVSDANGNASWNSKTPLRTASLPVTVTPSFVSGGVTYQGSAEVEWVHNLGYQPIIMITKEQPDEFSLMQHVSVSYYHVDNNTLKIKCSNTMGGIATGTLQILIVN